MVKLDKIYTKAGDRGRTRLATGEEVAKDAARVEAYGAVDETNSALGLARLQTQGWIELDLILGRIQNDLFDLGADLATPERDKPLAFTPLRVTPEQVERLEREIDMLNADLTPLNSFVLPGGHPAAAALHLARAICRRAERRTVSVAQIEGEIVAPQIVHYLNRLSDLLFVAARWANWRSEAGDVLWTPGANR
ncbi:MAG: cob(I)yrinic acid a,c-diamide adenosyltransferase [Caulobacterales bacterium]